MLKQRPKSKSKKKVVVEEEDEEDELATLEEEAVASSGANADAGSARLDAATRANDAARPPAQNEWREGAPAMTASHAEPSAPPRDAQQAEKDADVPDWDTLVGRLSFDERTTTTTATATPTTAAGTAYDPSALRGIGTDVAVVVPVRAPIDLNPFSGIGTATATASAPLAPVVEATAPPSQQAPAYPTVPLFSEEPVFAMAPLPTVVRRTPVALSVGSLHPRAGGGRCLPVRLTQLTCWSQVDAAVGVTEAPLESPPDRPAEQAVPMWAEATRATWASAEAVASAPPAVVAPLEVSAPVIASAPPQLAAAPVVDAVPPEERLEPATLNEYLQGACVSEHQNSPLSPSR